MLEACTDLITCEELLRGCLNECEYIGQVGLTIYDLDKLGQLIAPKMKADAANTIKFLGEYAPVCTAFFLVGQGIWYYQEGDYWTAVSTSLGLNIDSNQQVKLGQIFLQFIKNQGLQQISIKGSRRYVTSILLHGGIPQNSLPLLFQQVTRLFIEKSIYNPSEIIEEIDYYRELKKKKELIQEKIQEIKKKQTTSQKELEKLEHIRLLNIKANELRRKCEKWEQWVDLPEDCEQYYIGLFSELEEIKARRKNLIRREQAWKQLISTWCRKENELLDLLDKANQVKQREEWLLKQEGVLAELYKAAGQSRQNLVNQAQKLWPNSWKSEYGKILENLSWELLRLKLYQYKKVQQRYSLVVFEGFLLVSLAYYSSGQDQEAEADYIRQQMIFREELAATGNSFAVRDGEINPPKVQSQEPNFSAPGLRGKLETANQNLNAVKEDMDKVKNELADLLGGLPLGEDSLAMEPDELVKELYTLLELYRKYQQLSNRYTQLQAMIKEVKNSNHQVLTELTMKLDFQGSSMKIVELLADLESQIDKTHERRYLAEESGKSLQVKIARQLVELNQAEQVRNQEIAKLEEYLIKLGEGDLEKGINEVTIRQAVLTAWRDIEKQINEQIKYVTGLTFPVEDSLITSMMNEKSQELAIQKRQIGEDLQELGKYTDMFTGIDEPLYRFLIYGGDWVKDWVSGTVGLYLKAINEGKVVCDAGVNLPSRVIDGFNDWWQDQQSDPDAINNLQLSTEERFSTPVIMIDPDSGRISLNIGPQRFNVDHSNIPRSIKCQILNDDDGKSLKNINLKTYYCNNRGTLLETAPMKIELSSLVPNYRIYLQLDGQVKKEWIIPGISDEDTIIAFNESGPRIQLAELGCQKIWLLLAPTCQMISNISVLEETELRFAGRVYLLQLIDLGHTQFGSLELTNQYDQQICFPLQEFSTPFLEGGEIYPSLSSGDLPVYRKVPEIIHIPWQETAALADWKIVIKKGYRSPIIYYSSKLDQIPLDSVSVVNNYVQIYLPHPLIMGNCLPGFYLLQLRGPGWERYQFPILNIPDLDFGFEPKYCWPASAYNSKVKLTLFVPDHATMDVYAPARITNMQDEVYEIEITQEEDLVSGQLHLQTEEANDSIPLKIELPKIRWRLHGLDIEEYSGWMDKIQELWIGQLHFSPDLCLEVELPLPMGYYTEIVLDNGQIVPGTLTRNSNFKFKLLNFIDSLADGKNIHIFILRIYSSDRRIRNEGTLFSVRCHWEVVNIEAIQHHQDGQDLLYIKWEEKGEAIDRVLYLWRMEQPWVTPYKCQIPEGSRHLFIDLDNARLPSGDYLLHFATEDPWGMQTGRPSFPDHGINTQSITVNDDKTHLSALQISWSNDEQAIISGSIINVKGKCEVKVLLMGVASNMLVYWEKSISMAEDGKFTVKLDGSPTVVEPNKKERFLKRLTIREMAHWLGVIIEGKPCYYSFYLLAAEAPLEWGLDRLVDLSSWVDENIRFKFETYYDNYRIYSVLDKSAVQKLMAAWHDQARDYQIKTKQGVLEFSGQNRQTQLLLENGVVCIDPSCNDFGQLLSGIQEWYQNHPFCKGYEHNITWVEGELFWLWDTTTVIEEYQQKYSSSFINRVPLLYTGYGDILAGPRKNWSELGQILWEQEKALFFAIKGGHH